MDALVPRQIYGGVPTTTTPSAYILAAGTVTETFSNGAGQNIVVGSQTLSGFGAQITVDGHTIFEQVYSGPALIEDSTTIPFTRPMTASSSYYNANAGETVAAGIYTLVEQYSSGNVVIDGETLVLGGPGIAFKGATVTNGPSGVVAEEASTTIPITHVYPSFIQPTELAAGSISVEVYSSSGGAFIDGLPITSSGDDLIITETFHGFTGTGSSISSISTVRTGPTITYGPSGFAAVEASTTRLFTTIPSIVPLVPGAEALAVDDDLTITVTPLATPAKAFVVEGQTITPSQAPLTLSGGAVISDDGGTLVVVGGPSLTGESFTTITSQPVYGGRYTAKDGLTITAAPVSGHIGEWIVNGNTTLALSGPGAVATVGNKTISNQNGVLLEVNATATTTLATGLREPACLIGTTATCTSHFGPGDTTFLTLPPPPAATEPARRPNHGTRNGVSLAGALGLLGAVALCALTAL